RSDQSMSLLDFSKAYKTPKEMNKILLEGYMDIPITQSIDKGFYTITLVKPVVILSTLLAMMNQERIEFLSSLKRLLMG
ncbi:MAG: hypothetical protein ACRCVW_01200, partial [Brevinema sp.]